MKAIVMEVKNKNVIIMTSNGEFIKIRTNKELKVGDEIDSSIFEKAPGVLSITEAAKTTLMRITSIAAALILIFGVGYGAYSYNVPYSYISLDINPSIEIKVNKYDRIIELEGVDEDGKMLADLTSYKYVKINEGIQNIINAAVQNGYISKEKDNTVFMTLSSKDESKIEILSKTLETSASEEIQSSGVETELYIENIPVENHVEAEKLGVSPGKLVLVEKLKEKEPEADVENYINTPVKEIIKSIEESTKGTVFQNRMKKSDESTKDNSNESKENKIDVEDKKDRSAKENKGNKGDKANKDIKANKDNEDKKVKDNKKDKLNKESKKQEESKKQQEDKREKEDKKQKVKENKNSKDNNKNKENNNNKDKKVNKDNKGNKDNKDSKDDKETKGIKSNSNKDKKEDKINKKSEDKSKNKNEKINNNNNINTQRNKKNIGNSIIRKDKSFGNGKGNMELISGFNRYK